MESGTDPEGNSRVRSYLHLIATVLCLLLVLASLIQISTSSHGARGNAQPTHKQNSQLIPLDTPPTDITATATGIPTLTPINSPSPKPSATKKPTPKPTRIPTATPTTRPTPTAGATATPTTATTPQSTATATKTVPTATQTQPASTDQTPTAIPGGPTPTTNGDSTPPQNQSSNDNSSIGNSFFPFIIGALVFVVIVSSVLLGLIILRKRLPPVPVLRKHLPPSGAQPWQRTRMASMNGNTNLYGINNEPQMPLNQAMAPFATPNANLIASSANTMSGFPPPNIPNSSSFPGNPNGFPPPNTASFPGNGNGFPPPNTGGFPGNGNGFPPPNPGGFPGRSNGLLSSNTGSFSANGNGFPPPNPGFSHRGADFLPGNKGSDHIPAVTAKFPSQRQGSGHLSAITGKLPSQRQGSGHPPVATGGLSSNMQGNTPVTGGPSPTKAQQAPLASPHPPFAWSSDDLGPFADQIKPVKRSATRLIRLEDQIHTSSGALSAIPGGQPQPKTHRISEELPSLTDPFLRDTSKQYIPRSNEAGEKGPK